MSAINPIQKTALNIGTEVLMHAAPGLARVRPIRRALVRHIESTMLNGLKNGRATSQYPPGVDEDRTLMGLALLHSIERALVDHPISPAARRRLLKNLMQKLLIEQGDRATVTGFSAEHGVGRYKVDDLERYGDPAKLAVMRQIKRTIDPNGIMNPGAVLRA